MCTCLTGCLTWPARTHDAAPSPVAATVGQYHFDWKLSGNRAVAPLQVFDDGKRTWLQFPAGQPVPAIFARLPQGDQLLTPTLGQGGLLMLDGVWPQLAMRGGSLQSMALRLPAVTEVAASPDRPAVDIPVHDTVSPGVVRTVDVSTPDVPPPSPAPAFQVSPADGTLRTALSRWADTAGWTFAFEHWAVEVDIPIVAPATFTVPFEQAVQELLISTELSEQPLRPCFYTNRVLRIVPHTQPCDRSAMEGH